MQRSLPVLLLALASIPLPLAGADGPAIDLELVEMGWTPERPVAGENVTLWARVQNHGSTTSGRAAVEFWLDNVTLRATAFLDIGPGQTRLAYASWNATLGTTWWTVIVDPRNEIVEVDEGNNMRGSAIQVASQQGADLVVETMRFVRDPGSNTTGSIQVTVANRAPTATPTFAVQVDVDDAMYAIVHGAQLGAWSSTTLGFPWEGPFGVHRVVATADTFGEVLESREDNNALDRSLFFTSPAPDLVADAWFLDDSAFHGDVVDMRVRVTNAGDAAAGISMLRIEAPLQPNATYPIPALGPGDSFVATVEVRLTRPGWFQASAVADATGNVTESMEWNNAAWASRFVPLRPRPDLATYITSVEGGSVRSAVLNASNPYGPVTVKAIVCNHGNATAEPFAIEFRARANANRTMVPVGFGESVQTQEAPAVLAWSCVDVEFVYRPVAVGDVEFLVEALTNQVEWSRANNRAVRAHDVAVGGIASLVVA